MKITMKFSTLFLLMVVTALLTAMFPVFVWPRLSMLAAVGPVELFFLSSAAGMTALGFIYVVVSLAIELVITCGIPSDFTEGTVLGVVRDKDRHDY